MPTPRKTIPIFLCYRQSDGRSTATWLYQALHETTLIEGDADSALEVYFDQAAAYSDWTKIHLPSLRRARAFIAVCTPGAYAETPKVDWVHEEIRWWLRHRTTAPIVVDATGEGDRWVPERIKRRWPNAQRIVVRPESWRPEDREAIEARTVHSIREGLRLSERRVLFEDLEEKRRQLLATVSLAVATVAALLLATSGLALVWNLNRRLVESNAALNRAAAEIKSARGEAASLRSSIK